MTIKTYLLLGAVSLLLAACSDEMTIYQDTFTDTIVVENGAVELEDYVSLASAGVIDIYGSDQGNTPNSKNEIPAGDFPLTQVAQVEPPIYEGVLLTSTHVHVAADYAYVSYNTAGESYLGAVDILNISNPRDPRLSARLLYRNADINSLAFDNGYLYFVGGTDATASEAATEDSFVAKIPVISGKFDLTQGITYGYQIGKNATDLVVDANTVIVSSGNNGALTVYNKADLSIIRSLPYADLRSIAQNGSQLALLNAGSGVTILDSNYETILQIPVSTDLGAASKKSMDFLGDRIVIPEAYKGAGVYDANSGSLLEQIDIPTNPALENPGDKTTNAVGLNDNVLLMANGGAGICLSEADAQGRYALVGILELEGSMNFLATKGDYIIAASGKSGVQVIKFNRPDASLQDRCKDLPPYEGSSKLIVRVNESQAYSGSKRFNNINVNGALLLCGSWTVRNAINLNQNALFEMQGMMTVGRNNRRRDIRVRRDATLRIEGDLTLYGDLILEEGATLEFLGTANSIEVFGSVDQEQGVTITGTFDDVRDKF